MSLPNWIRDKLATFESKADFSLYCNFIDSCPTRDKNGSELHHILPRSAFQEDTKYPDNLIFLSYQDHFKAHYWLAVCAPQIYKFQLTFYYMANNKTVYQVSEEELPSYAEVYERGRILQSKIVTEYNEKENIKLQNFQCDICGKEFIQVTKGVFGGHRRFCINHAAKKIPDRPNVIFTDEQIKRCGKCLTNKPLNEFNKERKARLGRANFCRLCARAHNKAKNVDFKLGTIKNETNTLKDYTCPNCEREFKQVKPGVFGGHRRSCINYRDRREEFLKWSGTIQEFANLHELPFQTVWRWHLNRK